MKNELIMKYLNSSEEKSQKEITTRTKKIQKSSDSVSFLQKILVIWEEKKIPKFYQELLFSYFEFCHKGNVYIIDILMRELQLMQNNESTIQVFKNLY